MADNLDEEIEINRIRARLASLEAERADLEASLAEIERRKAGAKAISACLIFTANTPTVTTASPTADKVALFRRLFAGRSDVFPLRWENAKTGKAGYAPACANEWVRGVCGKPQVKCGECPHQAFIPVTDEIIDRHLRGGNGPRAFVVGVYPMLPDETCWFLAADFDKESWAADAAAMVETCKAKGVPAALERSRSGNGAHVWIFFSEPVPTRAARQLGAAIMTETMERRPEIGFASYDRFFPSQDTMPVGGFGNLIALPLQRRARERGNSAFIDEALLHVPDDQERLILATGRYIGEGFDDSRLDTLFLTMPISWKGTLAQYVGRLHRQHHGKTEVLVVDYVDEAVPMLARMAAKRRTGYRALGYTLE